VRLEFVKHFREKPESAKLWHNSPVIELIPTGARRCGEDKSDDCIIGYGHIGTTTEASLPY
jgi:hypothetical protein